MRLGSPLKLRKVSPQLSLLHLCARLSCLPSFALHKEREGRKGEGMCNSTELLSSLLLS